MPDIVKHLMRDYGDNFIDQRLKKKSNTERKKSRQKKINNTNLYIKSAFVVNKIKRQKVIYKLRKYLQ